MGHQLYYLELSEEVIRFEPVSQLTNVFFDDSNKQIFAVRSGGATGVVVKGPTEQHQTLSFCMDDKGPIRSIKFNPDMKILAVQRLETCVEFIQFNTNQPNLNNIIVYNGKNSRIFGFIWIHSCEIAIISTDGVETLNINIEKRQIKSLKSFSLTINWFLWCQSANLSVLSSNDRHILTPCILKQGTITKLPKLEYEKNRILSERDVTLGQLYNVSAILILRTNPDSQFLEVIIYCLTGPGLAPKKCHILRLAHTGRFAMNIVDDLIAVHHQASGTSMLFDTGLNDETDANGIATHLPITPGKPLKPFTLKLPSLSFNNQLMNCELYSTNWVIFQPNIIIDAKLGCLWYVKLNLNSLCALITNRVRLVDVLLQRTNGLPFLIDVLKKMLNPHNFNGTLLPVIEQLFNKINAVYTHVVNAEFQQQLGQPSTIKQPTNKQTIIQPRVLLDQNEMFTHILSYIAETDYVDKILMIYLHSLAKHAISAKHDISKMIINGLVRNNQLDTLRELLTFSLINESKPLGCFLLSLSNVDRSITQMALDMLHKLNAETINIEVLLGQGKIVDALRLAKSLPHGATSDGLSARKYLEAAVKTNDSVVFHSVYIYFQQRNITKRGSPQFLKSELCEEYDEHYRQLFLQENK